MNTSQIHQLTGVMRDLVVALMRSEGRDFNRCEYKGCVIPDDRYEIHHTRYEGATYYDLIIVCHGCNQLGVNTGLR